MAGLRRQRLRVLLAGSADPVTVEAINPDYLRIEADAERFGVPTSPKKAPMTYMTCLAWAALKRTGGYDGSLAEFKARDCELLEVVPDDDPAGDDVRPTDPGRVTG